MSRFHRSTVTCPLCGNDVDAVLWDLIDAGTDPDLKERLLKKKIQQQECQNCGETFILAEPLIYREDQQHLLVFYWPEEKVGSGDEMLPDPAAFPDWRLRRVSHYNELIEQIHIRDHHCDDRLMAVVKVAIRSHGQLDPAPSAVYFLTADDQSMRFLVRTVDEQWFTVDFPTDLYRNTESLFEERLPPDTGWQLIDEAYGVDLVNQMADGPTAV
jgi:hypothetical protein